MKLNLKLWRQPLAWSASMSRAIGGLAWMGQFVILTHYRACVRTLVALGMIVALYLVVVLLYIPPPGAAFVEELSVHLDEATVRRMASWLDARAQARAAGLRAPTDVLRP